MKNGKIILFIIVVIALILLKRCFKDIFSLSDLVSIITAIIMYVTVLVMKEGNETNSRLNRLEQIENTIMKQIEFHNNLLKRIYVNYESVGRGFGFSNAPINAYGEEAFEILYNRLKQIYSTMPGNSYKSRFDMNVEENRIKDSFTQLYKEYGVLFGNYFKNLYLLVKYINGIDVKDFPRSYYMDLVKSQLSKYEILLLAYDCIWIQDQPKGQNFIDFAKECNLLSALETNELIKSVSPVKHTDIFKDHYGIIFREPVEFTNT
ncbi:putative phage abortive infection protein [Xylanibacter oryzae]|uniref:putative phage abortive infection protein n=1 Tax=Xylanibacter oryzae TaxID=185293 RepID=UPI0004AF7E01|nr:putative phage abortive infection protein [Xylanibacter oryzae]